MNKKEIAGALEEIALLLDLSGENVFKVRAYENAARALESFEGDLASAVADGSLKAVKGIGAAIFEKIAALAVGAPLPYLEELRGKFPRGLFELFRIPGLGPKKVRVLYEKLGIESLAALEKACRQGRLLDIPGLGAKTQENILKGIALTASHAEYRLFNEAEEIAAGIREALGATGLAARIDVAGSYRRRKEVIRDLDFLASTSRPESLARAFLAMPEVESVIAGGATKTSARLKSGMAADLRLVTEREFPAALLYFTGSKEHNTALRGRAKKLGYKLNEYGLSREGSSRPLPCASEEEIYRRLGLAFIPPELREGRGEIEAAERGEIPRLVEPGDIRGLFHVHTTESDGTDTLSAMLSAVAEAGFEYVAITDHSKSAGYAHGLDEDRVRRQHEAIAAAQKRFPGMKIYKGTEADILADGTIDFGDDFLECFDVVVASVHSRFGLSEKEQTRRLVRAVENPRVTMLGHPTGRLLLAREGFAVDLDAVIGAAAASRCAIEVNASPHRFDLDWRYCRTAVEKGVALSINPDAHSVEDLKVWRYGVGIARKGWATRANVLNAKSTRELDAWLAARRSLLG
jgi:DNA polymerase (family 10)